MKSTTTLRIIVCFLPLLCIPGVVHAGSKVAIIYDANNPMHAFGVRDLRRSLEKTGNKSLTTTPISES